MSFRRTAGWFGIGFVLLEVTGYVLWGAPPATEATAGEIGRFFAEAGSQPKVGAVCNALAYCLAVPFIAGFVIPLLKSDREHGEAYGWVAFGGFMATGATALVGLSGSFAQVLRGGAELDAAAMRAVSDISSMVYGLAVLLMTVWAGATAVAVFRRRIMPRWFGSLSAIAGISGVSGVVSAASARLGWVIAIGFASLVVWVFVASVVMLRDGQSYPEESPQQASVREGGAA